MPELKDIVTAASLLFAVCTGIFAYVKWRPQRRSIDADTYGKLIINLEKMTALYDAERRRNEILESEKRGLLGDKAELEKLLEAA
jgi:hypothetical protein